MLKAIEAKGKVERCYDMLKARVSGFGGEPLVVKVGFRGGGGEETVIWIEPYDLWHELSESWWNAFGVGRPVLRGSNSITCEIISPATGWTGAQAVYSPKTTPATSMCFTAAG
ncbi:hypothetical protein DRQ05_01015 [bacterium]|nr:MAG: hypothetical protein DRQ05_01015 [bacterium]